MEAAIKNIAFSKAASNLVVIQLMECEVAVVVTVKVAFTKELNWTMVIAKNVRQVVSWAMETLVNVPKQEEHKFNLRLIGFDVKEGEIEKKLVQRLNTELFHGLMRL